MKVITNFIKFNPEIKPETTQGNRQIIITFESPKEYYIFRRIISYDFSIPALLHRDGADGDLGKEILSTIRKNLPN